MKEIKVRGIVIRQDPMGDKDKRVVLLTKEQGRLTILAKGAMTGKSRYSALTQLFSYGDFVLTKGRTFYYIKEAQLIESFYKLRSNLDRLAYASFMLEVADTLSLEGQDNGPLLLLLLRSLYAMTMAKEKDESIPCSVFIFRALAGSGFYPQLFKCATCGKDLTDLEPDQTLQFDVVRGAFHCPNCRQGGLQLSRGCIRAMRYIITADESKAFSFELSEKVRKELFTAVTQYLLDKTERRFEGLDFIGKINSQS